MFILSCCLFDFYLTTRFSNDLSMQEESQEIEFVEAQVWKIQNGNLNMV